MEERKRFKSLASMGIHEHMMDREVYQCLKESHTFYRYLMKAHHELMDFIEMYYHNEPEPRERVWLEAEAFTASAESHPLWLKDTLPGYRAFLSDIHAPSGSARLEKYESCIAVWSPDVKRQFKKVFGNFSTLEYVVPKKMKRVAESLHNVPKDLHSKVLAALDVAEERQGLMTNLPQAQQPSSSKGRTRL